MMYNRCNTENTEHYSDALEPTNMCIVAALCSVHCNAPIVKSILVYVFCIASSVLGTLGLNSSTSAINKVQVTRDHFPKVANAVISDKSWQQKSYE